VAKEEFCVCVSLGYWDPIDADQNIANGKSYHGRSVKVARVEDYTLHNLRKSLLSDSTLEMEQAVRSKNFDRHENQISSE